MYVCDSLALPLRSLGVFAIRLLLSAPVCQRVLLLSQSACCARRARAMQIFVKTLTGAPRRARAPRAPSPPFFPPSNKVVQRSEGNDSSH